MKLLDNAAPGTTESPFQIRRASTVPPDTAMFSSPITRMLLSSDGLTTTLLESCTGRRVRLQHAAHATVPARSAPSGAAGLLGLGPGDELVVRRSTLVTDDGREVSANHVVARIDLPGAECLTDPATLLGSALHAAGTGFRRTVLDVGLRDWDGSPVRPAAFKTYLLWHHDIPAVAISELFNPEIIPADRTADHEAIR